MDEEIIRVRQSQAGDQAAFETLIRSYQQMIHSLTYRMTGSVADAQDLAQETFIRAYQRLDTYRSTAKFSSWLYRIAVNACLDWRRRELRRGQLHTQWSDAQAGEVPGPETQTQADEQSREVQAALMQLPDKQRAAIVLTVYGGHNHVEAAAILGCSEPTISWRIFSARRKLKKILSRKGGPHE